jgi:hypothetical protein
MSSSVCLVKLGAPTFWCIYIYNCCILFLSKYVVAFFIPLTNFIWFTELFISNIYFFTISMSAEFLV